jgi:hypothetical protein
LHAEQAYRVETGTDPGSVVAVSTVKLALTQGGKTTESEAYLVNANMTARVAIYMPDHVNGVKLVGWVEAKAQHSISKPKKAADIVPACGPPGSSQMCGMHVGANMNSTSALHAEGGNISALHQLETGGVPVQKNNEKASPNTKFIGTAQITEISNMYVSMEPCHAGAGGVTVNCDIRLAVAADSGHKELGLSTLSDNFEVRYGFTHPAGADLHKQYNQQMQIAVDATQSPEKQAEALSLAESLACQGASVEAMRGADITVGMTQSAGNLHLLVAQRDFVKTRTPRPPTS